MIASITSSHTYDVKCAQITPSHCFIRTAIDLQDNDELIISAMDHSNLVTHFEIATGSNLRHVPKAVFETFPHLEAVTLNSANIKALTPSTFQNAPSLQELRMKMNKITKLQRALFTHAPNLETLDLSGNEIASIEDETFDGLSKLRTLKLNGNRLKELKTRTLFGLGGLEFLHLYSNKLTTIESHALNLPELTEVFFGNNRLRNLPSDLFSHTPNLEITEFSDNRLTHIGDSFVECHKVYSLSFENNPVEDIDLMKFARMTSLSSLSLNCTNFKFPSELPAKDSAKVASSTLKSLNFANNNLSNANILEHLIMFPELQRLYLYNNNFTELQNVREINNILPKLQLLDLMGNDLNVNWLRNNAETFKRLNIDVMS